MLTSWKLCHVLCCFLQSGKCSRAKTVTIIYNSPLFFNWYLPANIALRHVTDVINYVWLTNIFKHQKYRKHIDTNCQIESHVDAANLFYPNLYFDRFTTLQINSSDLKIFMSLEGEK